MRFARILSRHCWGISLVALFCFIGSAQAKPTLDLLKTTAELVQEEKFSEAIREAEAAADNDVVDADLSFNRGLAYLRRGSTTTRVPGDLAQAVAGFAESLELRPGDAEAERGLEQARLLIAQDRAQKDTSPENSNLGILERVLLSIAPLILATVAALGSLVLCVGLLLLASRNSSRRTAGAIVTLVGSLLLLPSLLLAGVRHTLFSESAVAVVIADGAETVDAGGKRISGRPAFRKGTLLHLGEPERGLVPLVGLGSSAFVPIERVRFLESNR